MQGSALQLRYGKAASHSCGGTQRQRAFASLTAKRALFTVELYAHAGHNCYILAEHASYAAAPDLATLLLPAPTAGFNAVDVLALGKHTNAFSVCLTAE